METDKTFSNENGQLKVIKVETVQTEILFDLGSLIKQLDSIRNQKDRDNAQRDLEIAEVTEMIRQAEGLGIKHEIEPDSEPNNN